MHSIMSSNKFSSIFTPIKLFLYSTVLACLLVTISCDQRATDNQDSFDNEKSHIVVTTTHMRDLVEKITGNRFRITALMGPGVDPHIYKPTSKDILALSKADIVIFHGMMLEGRLTEALANGKKRGILTFDATAALPNDQIIFPGEHTEDN